MTRLVDPLKHVLAHAAATNILSGQHHLRPMNTPVSNTALSVEPLPGGPGIWDIPVPFDAHVVMLSGRGPLSANDKGGKRGGGWTFTRNQYLDATGYSEGGPSAWQNGVYPGFWSKIASAIDISHRVFDATGKIAFNDAYLYQTGLTTRVLRTFWQNYGASFLTLSFIGELEVIG